MKTNNFGIQRRIKVLFTVFLLIAVLSLGMLIAEEEAFAQYPSKPITLTVPWGAGGGTDTLTRLLVEPLSKALGVPIIIVNKPGAAGAVGLQEFATLKPDGYNLTISTKSLILQKYSMAEGLIDYKNYTPIARLASSLPILIVHKDSPWQTLDEFIDDAKDRPGEIIFSNSGTGGANHLWAIKFASDANIIVQQVPYDGGTQAATAVMGKHVDAVIVDTPIVRPLMSSGDLRILACGVDTPDPLYPNVPTFDEYGIKLWEHWYGMWAPKGVPEDVIQTISDSLFNAVKDERYLDGLQNMALINSLNTPDKFAKLWEENDEEIKKVFASMR